MRWQATGGKHQFLIIDTKIPIMKLLYKRQLIKDYLPVYIRKLIKYKGQIGVNYQVAILRIH